MTEKIVKIDKIKLKPRKKIVELESTDEEPVKINIKNEKKTVEIKHNKDIKNNIGQNKVEKKIEKKVTKVESIDEKPVKNNIKNNKRDKIDVTHKKVVNKEVKNKTTRIDEDGYARPEQTYTDKLSKEQIRNLLIDYEKINSIDELADIPEGTHIRYFRKVGDEYKFRTGGVLAVKGLPDYVCLTNGRVTWSVQLDECILYKRITSKQIKDEYEKLVDKKNIHIEYLQNYLRDKLDEIKHLRKKMDEKDLR